MHIKKVALALLASSMISTLPAVFAEAKPVDYEKALMRYVLSYEALLNAKQDPSKASEVPKRLKKYRESYAEYLKLLNENDLYNPADQSKKNDPAGNYNRKMQKEKKPRRKWQKVDTKPARQQVEVKLEAGEDLDSAVDNTTEAVVPPTGNSVVDYGSFTDDMDWDPLTGCPMGYDPAEFWAYWKERFESGDFNDAMYPPEIVEKLRNGYNNYNSPGGEPGGEPDYELGEEFDNNIAEQAEDSDETPKEDIVVYENPNITGSDQLGNVDLPQ